MRCVYVESFSTDALSGLKVGELTPTYPQPVTNSDPQPNEWVRVRVHAASLNHHDLWSLRGVGLTDDQLPMILGTDAAGVNDDGDPVIVHSLINSPLWVGMETNDPKRTLLSEKFPGTFAEYVWVPRENLVPKPEALSFTEAACLPTAYLTAYNMLFDSAGIKPGQRVLIQGATGGVATAAIQLARAAGAHITVATRSLGNSEHAYIHGAHHVVESGQRISPVDAVIETVGQATWQHSLRSLKPGGVIAVAGATTGPNPQADLNRVFFRNLRIVGTTMGSRQQLAELIEFLVAAEIRPRIYGEYAFDVDSEIHQAFSDFSSGRILGKAVLVRE